MSDDATRRTLLLMRHAEAESFAADDHARRLTAAGRRAATAAGRWIAGVGTVDHAIVSSAVRALQTYAAVAEAAGLDREPRVEAALYAAGEDSALEVLRTVDPAARTVLWVGHNPTASLLAQSLSDEHPAPDAFAELTMGYPPATVTVLTVPGEWADLAPGGARVRAFHGG